MDKPVKPEPKKPYSPPKMTVYGTVREITLHVGHAGQRDAHPVGAFTKTNA